MGMQVFIAHLAPQIILVVGVVITLMVAIFVRQERQHWNAAVTMAVLTISALTQIDLLVHGPTTLTFEGIWALDPATSVAALIVLASTAVVVMLSPEWMSTDRRHGEYYPMLLMGALGAIAMAAATDLNLLVVAVTLSSISGYVLAGYHRGSPFSVEAGIKYFLVGAFANLVLLIGVVLGFAAARTTLYEELGAGFAGSSAWLMVPTASAMIVGLAFKAGAVPAHSWVPDVAQGAPVPSAAFLTVVPKVGGLVALARLVHLFPEDVTGWRPTVAVIAALTMTLGNLAALRQDDVRRLLGWSSVSQAGYALMAVAAIGRTSLAMPALLTFLAAYAASNLGAFSVVGALRGRTRLHDYIGLGSQRPWLATALVVSLLSLVGIPPLAGFVGKLTVFTATVDAGLTWLAVIAVFNTVLSLAYYLRVIAPVALGERSGDIATLALPRYAVGWTIAMVLALGFGAELILEWSAGAALPT